MFWVAINSRSVSNHIHNSLVFCLTATPWNHVRDEKKWAAEFCHCEKIDCFMPYQHEWPNIYIMWQRIGKKALFTHTIFVETGYTSKLLQGEMCRSWIDNMTWPIMKNVPCVCIYIAAAMSKKSTSTFLFAWNKLFSCFASFSCPYSKTHHWWLKI